MTPLATFVASMAGGVNTGTVRGMDIYDHAAPTVGDFLPALLGVINNLNNNPTRRGVINLSIELPGVSAGYMSIMDGVFLAAINAGGIPVAAAGNDASGACSVYPANSAYTINVGSYDDAFDVSTFSNYGECIDIYGPGTLVWGAVGSVNYVETNGTSFASPAVAGIVATMLVVNPDLTFDNVCLNVITKQNKTNKQNKLQCKDVFGFVFLFLLF